MQSYCRGVMGLMGPGVIRARKSRSHVHAETVFGTYGHLRTQIQVTCTCSQPPRARPRSSAHVNPDHMYTQRSHVHVSAQHTMICSHKFLLSLDFTSKNERFYFPCTCDLQAQELFSLDFTSKNGRFYFACTCDLRAQVSVFIGFYQ